MYILRFSNRSLYIGQTNNLPQRLKDHLNKATRASKFSKDNGNFNLVHQEEFPTRLGAMRREKQIKGWTGIKKEALMNGDLESLKRL